MNMLMQSNNRISRLDQFSKLDAVKENESSFIFRDLTRFSS